MIITWQYARVLRHSLDLRGKFTAKINYWECREFGAANKARVGACEECKAEERDVSGARPTSCY